MEKLLSELGNKIKTLNFRVDKTYTILEKRDRQALERQQASIANIVEALNTLKETIEEKKIAKGEDDETIEEWSSEIEPHLEKADESTRKIQQEIKQMDLKEEEDEAAERHKNNLKHKRELWEQKVELEKSRDEEKAAEHKLNSSAKLPKLSITPFSGKIEEWLPFWGKFTAEIDSTCLNCLTKFGYLKELLVDRVRTDIDGLPFTEEGYANAKAILEAEYGRPTEIVNAYIRNIMELPIIAGTSPNKVRDFYKQLRFNVQSLETLGRLADVKGNVRSTIDKLKGIKSDLVRGNEGWQDWDYKDLLKELKTWTEINPAEDNAASKEKQPLPPHKYPLRSKFYNAQSKFQPEPRPGIQCIYCDGSHRATDCTSVTDIKERRGILSNKKRCFNCTGSRHQASECKSKTNCQKCNLRHHTSICDTRFNANASGNQLLIAAGVPAVHVIYPVVIVQVEGMKCRALLDTGAGSSYASAALLDRLSKRQVKKETRKIEMMLGATTREVELSQIEITATDGTFSLPVEVTKVNKGELLFLANPRYQQLISRNAYLNGVDVVDHDTKDQLPVHIILGASEYAKLKTETAPKIGQPGQPVAELTRFGWTIISPGKEPVDLSNMLLCQTSHVDYEQLCRLDVLGLTDTPPNDQGDVYAEFKEQLTRDEEGWYETALPWRGDHPPLPSNKNGSLRRLTSLVRKLERGDLKDKYSEIIEEQRAAGVVESAETPAVGKEFYIPHKPVVRAEAESTKLRIVYDASARAYDGAPSLNDCLYAGPPLQNKLWDVLVRGRFNPVAVTGDLQKAFLQVRVRKNDRDAMRFHWHGNEQSKIETLRFTRALFGLTSSPFLLGGVIDTHLTSWEEREPEVVARIKKDLYVDDLISGSTTVNKAQELKQKATTIFQDASFKLHKWHSNAQELESDEPAVEDSTYAKQQLGTPPEGECSLLGLGWNTERDTLSVVLPEEKAVMTKRGVLAKLAKVYDPLGLVSPITLSGKIIYRAVCNEKTAWDAPITEPIVKIWGKWESALPKKVELPRSLPGHREDIESIELHAFGDASANGVAACVYAVVQQPTGTNQGLVAARSRLSKQGLTIPRLELVAGHMAVNLVTNVKAALQGFPVDSTYCWLDSTVALYWIKGKGDHKQFVENRVRKINSHQGVTWRHVPTKDNPADLASRGGDLKEAELWWNGPEWLSNVEGWPADIVTEPSLESKAEAKMVREVLSVAVDENNEISNMLQRYPLQKAVRVVAWMRRFVNNSRSSSRTHRKSGPLTTEETERQRLFWTKQAQDNCNLEEDRVALNLQPNQEGLLECRGRVQGEYPVYLPDIHLFTRRVVEEAHQETLHGGIGLTMARVRSRYWIPRLRRLVKKVRGNCHGCKRYQAMAYAAPPPADLPTTRTQGVNPYQVIGVDYAGPMRYRISQQREGKAYVLLYACSLSRGIYLDLLPNLETSECLLSLKRFIARRGRPDRIYSDNGRTFVGAARWLRKVAQDERMQNYLSVNQIHWQFNLSRAPWWGGQFERMIGLVKSALNKTIGNGMLRWKELQEVLLDVEVALNHRPLSYVEDDVQFPLLTPNTMLFANSNVLPELQPYHIESYDVRKRAKHLLKCKEAMWGRWTSEYLRGLRERHRAQAGAGGPSPKVGEVVIIKTEERNRGKWPLGIVERLIVGNDGVVRGARLRAGKSHVERAAQHLYPLELSCDKPPLAAPTQINPEAAPFRPRRDAAVAARLRLQDITENDS